MRINERFPRKMFLDLSHKEGCFTIGAEGEPIQVKKFVGALYDCP